MHFTYADPGKETDLQQGDVIARSEALAEVIKSIHPYYLKDDYTCFIVVTQSCDLVRRPAAPGSRYITICAARPLSVAILREAEKFQDDLLKAANAVSDRLRDRLIMFVERLLNNNNHEYFYLHDEPSVGLSRSCAFLRLSIALRSDHYETLMASRVLGLSPSFRAKLGWLVGDIYSRVGTDDWVPIAKTVDEWPDFLRKLTEEHLVFLPDAKIRAFKKDWNASLIQQQDEIRRGIRETPITSRKDEVVDAVIAQLIKEEVIDAGTADEARQLLRNNPKLSSLIK